MNYYLSDRQLHVRYIRWHHAWQVLCLIGTALLTFAVMWLGLVMVSAISEAISEFAK